MESQFVWSRNDGCWIPDPTKRPGFSIVDTLEEDEKEDDRVLRELPTVEKAVESPQSDVASDPVVDIVCPEHPLYTGKRLGKKARQCETCLRIYQAVQESGYKETRNRS